MLRSFPAPRPGEHRKAERWPERQRPTGRHKKKPREEERFRDRLGEKTPPGKYSKRHPETERQGEDTSCRQRETLIPHVPLHMSNRADWCSRWNEGLIGKENGSLECLHLS